MDPSWKQLLPHLEASWNETELRVVDFEVGSIDRYGAGNTRINPSPVCFVTDSAVFDDVDRLIILGLPSSLAQALKGKLPATLQKVALNFLLGLVTASSSSCKQLIKGNLLPLALEPPVPKDLIAVKQQIEQKCKQSLSEVAVDRARGHSGNWLGWSAAYDICFRLPPPCNTMWLHLEGAQKNMSQFDMDGVHLTGGRLWAGAVVLARWVAALHVSASPLLGTGPILELGSGLGLPGMLMGKLGRKVALSDREPAVLEVLRENVETNNCNDSCRVLQLDWEQVEMPKVRRLLHRQRFSTVIGADLVYDGKEHADQAVSVLRHALVHGGNAFLVQPLHHRRTSNPLGEALSDAHFEYDVHVVPATGFLQDVLCGSWEPSQEYALYSIQVQPVEGRL